MLNSYFLFALFCITQTSILHAFDYPVPKMSSPRSPFLTQHQIKKRISHQHCAPSCHTSFPDLLRTLLAVCVHLLRGTTCNRTFATRSNLLRRTQSATSKASRSCPKNIRKSHTSSLGTRKHIYPNKIHFQTTKDDMRRPRDTLGAPG